MDGIAGPNVPGLSQAARPLSCQHCLSSEHVVIESMESLRPHPGELHVQVGYVCRECRSNYLHTARFQDVAAFLNRTRTLQGLLRFAGEYLHCGEPMSLKGSNITSIYASLSTEECEEMTVLNVGTKVLRCQCGFQLELPD